MADEPQLVRIKVYEGGEPSDRFLGYAYGLLTGGRRFVMLYTRHPQVFAELGENGELGDLTHEEILTAVDVAKVNTPGHVYAAAAKFALTGAS